jgi:outer membrane protein assembly factor BamB
MSFAAPQGTTNLQGAPRRGWQKWIPAAIIGLEVLALGGLQYAVNAELLPPAEGFLFRFSAVGLGTIVLFLWFVAWGPASRAVRLGVGLLGFASLAAAFAVLRIDGVNGDIEPRFSFRWSPRADELLPRAAGGDEVDLTTTTAEDYPQFLGPDRRATFGKVEFGRDWVANPPRLVWRQPIGAGWSSFAVVDHFGVTQEQRGEEELVTCYDVDDGQLKWSYAAPVRFDAKIAGVGPRATPTIFEGRVYAMGAYGNVVCLDGANGKMIWQHDVLEENDAVLPQWGKSCSPLVYENKVIVSAGGRKGKSLVAYDRLTGEEVWSGGDSGSSYSSPTVLSLAGVPQIVIVNQKSVAAHDPADGHVLWEHAWPETFADSPNVSQPLAVGDDQLLLTKGYGVGSALWEIKREGDEWRVDPVWKTRNLKTKFTNAVVSDGYAYGLDEDILSCIDVASGKRKWIKGRYNHGQVLLVGDLLLVQSETGDVALVEASPDAYRELTRFAAVTGQSWNYPVLVGRKLLVRTELEAACYELPPPKE